MKLPKLEGKYLILAITVPVAIVLDQITKILAIVHLKPLVLEVAPADRYVSVIDGLFRLKYTENPGAAWGLLRNVSPEFRVPFFIIVSIAAIGVIIWFFKKIELKQRLLPLAVSLVLGGAVGNLIDRFRMGKVVDFIDWFIVLDEPTSFLLFTAEAGEKHWPTFNIADAAISVGVVLLLVEMIFGYGKKKKEEGAGAEEESKA